MTAGATRRRPPSGATGEARPRRRPGHLAVAVAAASAYAWWVTGLRPFTATANIAVALAALAFVPFWFAPRRARPSPSARYTPVLVLLASAIGLEAVAMGLGGRSPTLPTLSTELDRTLFAHGSRFVVFWIWLGLGVLAVRIQRPRQSDDDQPQKEP